MSQRNEGPLLVISHEASRSGAPMVLLELLEALNPSLHRGLVVRHFRGGPLRSQMDALASQRDGSHRFGAVFVNSAVALCELEAVDSDVPALVYLHEDLGSFSQLDEQQLSMLRERVDLVYVVSQRARNALIGEGVDPQRISVVYPPVPRVTSSAEGIEAVRAELGWQPGELLIAGCGTVNHRKGVDLFVETVGLVARSRPVRAVWVGRFGPRWGERLRNDAVQLGLEGRFHLVGERSNPQDYLAAAHVVLAPSREDPQPLVPPQAACVGTPTVAFDLSGLGDYGSRGHVRCVEFPDAAALAEVLCAVADEPSGADMAERFAAWTRSERSVAVIAERVRTDLTTLLGEPL